MKAVIAPPPPSDAVLDVGYSLNKLVWRLDDFLGISYDKPQFVFNQTDFSFRFGFGRFHGDDTEVKGLEGDFLGGTFVLTIELLKEPDDKEDSSRESFAPVPAKAALELRTSKGAKASYTGKGLTTIYGEFTGQYYTGAAKKPLTQFSS